MSAKSRIAEQIARIKAEKANIVTTLSNLGITVPTGAKLADLPTQVNKLSTSDATAAATDMLAGKTAYVNNAKITGTIPSKAAETIMPGTADQTIAAGRYLVGAQTIKGDANLLAENIKKDVSLFGVTGSLVASQSGLVWGYPEVQQDPDAPLVYPVFFRANEPTDGTTYYVRPDGDNTLSGLTWETAWADFTNLSEKNGYNTTVNVYVESGIYPKLTTGYGVCRIYGGFAENHTWESRQPFENQSIISEGGEDNVSVVYSEGSVIDGMTFVGTSRYARLTSDGTVHFRNCFFKGNGAAGPSRIAYKNGTASCWIEHCLFAHFHNSYFIGAESNPAARDRYESNVFYNITGLEVSFVNPSRLLTLKDNLFLHCENQRDSWDAGLVNFMAAADGGATISGNCFVNCCVPTGGIINKERNDDAPVVISDNILINCTGFLKQGTEEIDSTNVTVSGNILLYCKAGSNNDLYGAFNSDGSYVYGCEEGSASTAATQTNLHRENPLATVTSYTTPGRVVTMTAQECLNAFVAGNFGTIDRA